ncbi:MAG: SusC/RagA family TonB-linked outer membrane protein [Bacteroidetes bacterium]|nr:SusC/RagA family TonB-linked outer membrane protein [Bacteroidota bacterium]
MKSYNTTIQCYGFLLPGKLRPALTLFIFLACIIQLSARSAGSDSIKVPQTNTRILENQAPITGSEPLQKSRITGTVTDADTGEPLVGVNIIIEGTTLGVITDADGKYSFEVPSQSVVLVFTYIGYNSIKIPYAGQATLDVRLVPDIKSLDEIVVVGYGMQKRVTASGSIASVSNKEIMKAPVANVANALTGIMPGLTVVNNSGHVGKENPILRLRGIGTMSGQLDPLVMVDGMERPMNDIDPNEIESVSILKDASSTAVFGVRGANGVILVTTKRGKDGPAKVNFASEFGISRPTRRPEFLSSYEYATLYNEAQINDGVAPGNVKYSAEAIEHYRTGDSPWLYPNTDWQEQMMRDYSPQQRYNLNISGGTKSTRYYVSAGYLAQTGIWKNFNNGYDNSDWSKRYNFRSNLDVDVTKNLTVSVNLGGTIKYVNLPNGQRSSPDDEDWQFFRYMMNSPPMAGAGWVDNKSYFVEGYDTPIKWMTGKGYRNDYNSEVNTLFALNHKLDFDYQGFIRKGEIWLRQ